MTLAMVWDMVEARLSRGCRAKVTYHLHGSDSIEDSTILAVEQGARMAGPGDSTLSEVPRVMIHTIQVWSRRPTGYERFNHAISDWIIPKGSLVARSNRLWGDGLNILRASCLREGGSAKPFVPAIPDKSEHGRKAKT